MASPTLTVVLPFLNAEKTLAAAIKSIVQQTFTDWELLLLDDGSTDSSLKVAQSFEGVKIKVFSDGKNKGLSTRLNQAIDLAQGYYIARMDADDVSLPRRFELQMDYLSKHPDVDVLGGAIAVVNTANGEITGIIPAGERHADICNNPCRGFLLPHPTWAGRKEWFQKNRYNSAADGVEDQDLLFRTYKSSVFAGLPDVLLLYSETRVYSKLLKRRLRFWRALGKTAMRRRAFDQAALISLFQLLKIAGDFANIKLGFRCAKYSAAKPDPALLEQCYACLRRTS
jgi:glycosyltransferase involved in cell wall biosynthesis